MFLLQYMDIAIAIFIISKQYIEGPIECNLKQAMIKQYRSNAELDHPYTLFSLKNKK